MPARAPKAGAHDRRAWSALIEAALDAAGRAPSAPVPELRRAADAAYRAVMVGDTNDRENPCNRLAIKARAYLAMQTADRRASQDGLRRAALDCQRHLAGAKQETML